jgi:hypothetical protein
MKSLHFAFVAVVLAAVAATVSSEAGAQSTCTNGPTMYQGERAYRPGLAVSGGRGSRLGEHAAQELPGVRLLDLGDVFGRADRDHLAARLTALGS